MADLTILLVSRPDRIPVHGAEDFMHICQDMMDAFLQSILEDRRYCLPIDEDAINRGFVVDRLSGNEWISLEDVSVECKFLLTRKGTELVDRYSMRLAGLCVRLFGSEVDDFRPWPAGLSEP